MPGITNFKVFNEQFQNAMTDEEYMAEAQRTGGLVDGIAKTRMHNKLFRQTSIMTAALAQYMANKGYTATDEDLPSLVSALTDAFNDIPPSIPSGIITMWSGSIATIPPGWNLCDGTNGTPDLRNRFVVGAGSSYGVGDAGGSNEVTLSSAQMPSHSHGGGSLAVGSGGGHSHGSGTLSTNTAGSHTHTYSRMATSSVIKFWSDDTPANGVITSTVDTSSSGSHSHSLSGSTSAAGDHSHSLSGSTASQGGGAAHENRPPYYALAYIMKL